MLVEEYLSKEYKERQRHIDLNEPCLERGGNSTNHRGVLAEYLNSPIYGIPADLCHACNNDKCSNPKHLYWGTRKENVQDAIKNGTFIDPWQAKVKKYGYEEACRINARGDKATSGRGNKGKPKSEEHKKKIAEAIRQKHIDKNK